MDFIFSILQGGAHLHFGLGPMRKLSQRDFIGQTCFYILRLLFLYSFFFYKYYTSDVKSLQM